VLHTVSASFAQAGIQCVVLKGSMTMEQRDKMIDAFTNNADVTVFLMSLKAGGAYFPC
jgi:DNA repair protein RAD16